VRRTPFAYDISPARLVGFMLWLLTGPTHIGRDARKQTTSRQVSWKCRGWCALTRGGWFVGVRDVEGLLPD